MAVKNKKPSLRKRFNRLKERFDIWTLPFFASHQRLAALYYFLFNSNFRREQQATLQGRLRYHQSLQSLQQSSPLLRRNTHRLEKGLIMRPMRVPFALDYIGETVECYQRAKQQNSLCADELKWVEDVLSTYFTKVACPEIEDTHKAFSAAKASKDTAKPSYIPYLSEKSPGTNISPEALRELFVQRRSRRWFLPTPVDSKKLNEAITMASYAPSACNRQPYQFLIYNQKKDIERVAKLAMGTKGFYENFPCLAVVVGDLSAYPEERDRHVIYIDASLASMQLMLALETMGLGSCPINWPDIEKREARMAKAIGLDPGKRVVMLMAIGTPDPMGGIPFSQKKGANILAQESAQ